MSENLFTPQAENSILSIILNSPEMAFEHSSLTTEMFSSAQNQITYQSISDLSNMGNTPSRDLVRAHLASSGKLNLVGGDEYFDWIMSKDSSIENFALYEGMVIDGYKARKLIELSTSIKGMVDADTSRINDVISNVQNKLDSLATASSADGASKLSESLKLAYDVIQARLNNPGLSGLSTGYKSIDMITGGHSKGDLWTIASRPSMGKSALILNSLLRSSAPVKGGFRSLLFSFEMIKQVIVDRFLAMDTGLSVSDIRLGALDKAGVAKLETSLIKLNDNDLYVDSNFHANPSYIVDTIKKMHKQHNLDAVYLDYLQLATERDDDANHAIGRVTRSLKKIAKDLNIAVCIVSQLNRYCEMRDDKRPVLSDLRQSGSIEEDSDMVAFLYRDDYYYMDSKDIGFMEFIVRKNRNGPTGMIKLKWDAVSNRIDETR